MLLREVDEAVNGSALAMHVKTGLHPITAALCFDIAFLNVKMDICDIDATLELHMTAQPSAPVSLLVLDGDGISPEITEATLNVLDAVQRRLGLRFQVSRAEVGLRPLAAQGTTFPAGLLEQARAADGVILGPVSHNDYPPASEGGINPSGHLRKHLDLFANIRPAKSHPDFLPAAAFQWTWSSFGKTPKAFMPTAPCLPGPESSCPPRM
ncbi:isocitrate/isopropylmalate family dehydrogenase [Pannonibacter sp. Pt2-lr]